MWQHTARLCLTLLCLLKCRRTTLLLLLSKNAVVLIVSSFTDPNLKSKKKGMERCCTLAIEPAVNSELCQGYARGTVLDDLSSVKMHTCRFSHL